MPWSSRWHKDTPDDSDRLRRAADGQYRIGTVTLAFAALAGTGYGIAQVVLNRPPVASSFIVAIVAALLLVGTLNLLEAYRLRAAWERRQTAPTGPANSH